MEAFDLAPDLGSLPVLWRGEAELIVAKPPGWWVHSSALSGPTNQTIVRLLRAQLGQRVYPVHRLDRPTSGCLLIALRPDRVHPLQLALAQGEKSYLALVRGAKTLDSIEQIAGPMKNLKGVLQEARTTIRCVGSSEDPRCSLFLATPQTGRYHQVRRHCRRLNHPVLGDSTHGDTRATRAFRERYSLPRLGLHCLSLAFVVPGETPVCVVCPVPDDLRRIWTTLPWWSDALERVPALSLEAVDASAS